MASCNNGVAMGIAYTVQLGKDNAVIVYGLPSLGRPIEAEWAEPLLNSMQYEGASVAHVYIAVGDEDGAVMVTAIFDSGYRATYGDERLVHRLASEWALSMLPG